MGIIDATMYLIEVLSERNRNRIIFDYVQSTSDTKKAGKFISDSLPPVIASVIGSEELEKIRIKLLNLPAHTGAEKLNLRN